jgi:orotidine-5'-phosphate decarboxylase
MRRIFVAIDTADIARAKDIARAVRAVAGGLKLGLEFFAAHGPSGVTELAEFELPIFLDLKLHDIPNTVAKAVQALRPLEPAILTVHAAGGQAMLENAKATASPDTKVVAVTVLTSLDGKDLAAAGVKGTPADQVQRLAALAQSAGLDGIVCSGEEVREARKAWPEGYFVVPGVRADGGSSADQKRTVTAREAVDAGASVLVIGRPITEAEDPSAAIRSIAATL